MQIVDTFYDMARQHKLIKGFKYGKPSEKGAGTDLYPLTWVDDPINGQTVASATVKLGLIRQSVSVDILGLPADDNDVLAVQKAAYVVGLSYAEKLKEYAGVTIDSFSWITLRDYYDDNAAGVRFTYYVNGANPINLCGDFFDPTKEFNKESLLPAFVADHPDGCAVFNNNKTLPNFRV